MRVLNLLCIGLSLFLTIITAAPPLKPGQSVQARVTQINLQDYYNQISKDKDPSVKLLELIRKNEKVLEEILKTRDQRFYSALGDIALNLLADPQISEAYRLRFVLSPDLVDWSDSGSEINTKSSPSIEVTESEKTKKFIFNLVELEDLLNQGFLAFFIPKVHHGTVWSYKVENEIHPGPEFIGGKTGAQLTRLVANRLDQVQEKLLKESKQKLLGLLVNDLYNSALAHQHFDTVLKLLKAPSIRPLLEFNLLRHTFGMGAQVNRLDVVKQLFDDLTFLSKLNGKDFSYALQVAGPHKDTQIMEFLLYLTQYFMPPAPRFDVEESRRLVFKEFMATASEPAFEVFLSHQGVALTDSIVNTAILMAARKRYTKLAVNGLESLGGTVQVGLNTLGKLFCIGYGLDIYDAEDLLWTREHPGGLDPDSTVPQLEISHTILKEEGLREHLQPKHIDHAIKFIFAQRKVEELELLFEYPDLLIKTSENPFKSATFLAVKNRDAEALKMILDERWQHDIRRPDLQFSEFTDSLFKSMIAIRREEYRAQLRKFIQDVPAFGQTLSDHVIEEVVKKAIQEKDKEAFDLATGSHMQLFSRSSNLRKWIEEQRSELYKSEADKKSKHQLLAETYSSLLEHGNIDEAIKFFKESELQNIKSGMTKDEAKPETVENQENWFQDYLGRDLGSSVTSKVKVRNANRAVLRAAPQIAFH
jgi:hypothetical protein